MSHRAVYKTKTAEYLDDFYNGVTRPREEAYEDASALMGAAGSLVNSTVELESREDGIESGSAAAFDQHWLKATGKSRGESVERVLRLGYQTAVELAAERGVAIETFWITGAGEEFEIHICESRERVNVFMIVPGEDNRPYGSEGAHARSWVVKVGGIDEVKSDAERASLDAGDPPVFKIQVSGPTEAPPPPRPEPQRERNSAQRAGACASQGVPSPTSHLRGRRAHGPYRRLDHEQAEIAPANIASVATARVPALETRPHMHARSALLPAPTVRGSWPACRGNGRWRRCRPNRGEH